MSEVDIKAIKMMLETMTRDVMKGLSITGKTTGEHCAVVNDKNETIANIKLEIYPWQD